MCSQTIRITFASVLTAFIAWILVGHMKSFVKEKVGKRETTALLSNSLLNAPLSDENWPTKRVKLTSNDVTVGEAVDWVRRISRKPNHANLPMTQYFKKQRRTKIEMKFSDEPSWN
jgi:hypothetical protein